MTGGWLVLASLTALAAFASAAVAVRSAPSGRAELGVVASLVFFALLGFPAMLLGYGGELGRSQLALASLVTSGFTLAFAAWGRPRAAFARETLRAMRKLARLPFDGLFDALRARSAIAIGVAWCIGLVGLALFMTWLAPSETWDGVFYHEPIVGFAIQNHGFAPVALPQHQAVQATNGYARLGECVSLWFVVFTDKTFIELPNTLAVPGLVLATYALARRVTDKVSAMTCAPVLILMPGLWTQLRTTYVDVEVAFFAVAAIHFATRPDVRARDAALATLAMALFVGTKLSAIAWVPPMAAIAYARMAWRHGRARPRTLAVPALGGVVLAALAALILVHNWRAFRDPLWPMGYDNASFGIHWKGLNTLAQLAQHLSLPDFVAVKWGSPIGGLADVHDRDYGYAIPWVIVPFAAIGLVRALASRASNLLLLAVVVAVSFVATPSMFPSRYNMHIAALVTVLAFAGVAGSRWTRAREGVLVAAVALSIVPVNWTRGWYFGMTLKRMTELVGHSASERAYMNSEDFDMPERVAKAREEELGPGDRVAFTQDVLTPGALWNFHFTNELRMIAFDDPRSFQSALDAYAPKWVVVAEKSAARNALATRPDRWAFLGPSSAIDTTVVYRRR